MVTSLDDIKKHNIVFVLYPSGGSGEFLASSLSTTVDNMAQPKFNWEAGNRVKFADCLGRSLNAAAGELPEQLVVDRFNLYLMDTDTSDNRMSIALAHVHELGVRYTLEHFSHAPIIEITTNDYVSQKFRDLSSWKKIGIKIYNSFIHKDCKQDYPKHLKVNWSDLFLTNTAHEYQRILDFLNATGDTEAFVGAVKEYCQRNQDLISQAHES